MAQDRGVTCVQEQMAAVGYDPGAVDGYPGRQTRAAISRFSAGQIKADLTLPVLTDDNGSVLCRLIGLADPRLQAHWPAQTDPIRILAGPGVAANYEGAVFAMARETLRRFILDYDLQLAMPVRIVISEGEAEFIRMMRDNSGGNLRDLTDNASYHCNTRSGVSGVTYGDLIGICLLPGQELGRGVNLAALNTVVAHEIVHSAQRQLAGRPPRTGNFQHFVDHRGPLWLTEGSATMIAEEIVTPGAMSFGYVGHLEEELLGYGWPDLAEFELRPNGEQQTRQLYVGGAVAIGGVLSPTAEDLGRVFGYYEAIGLGSDWRIAFAEQFGQTPAEFYTGFMARNPVAVSATKY